MPDPSSFDAAAPSNEQNLIVPDFGQGAQQLIISDWLCGVGDDFIEDEPLVRLIGPGLLLTVPAPTPGRIKRIDKQINSAVALGEVLAEYTMAAD